MVNIIELYIRHTILYTYIFKYNTVITNRDLMYLLKYLYTHYNKMGGKSPTRKCKKVSLKLCMLLLNTLSILLSTFFNVWSIYLAPIPNNWMQKPSSVAQNSGTFMYWKCSGKRSVLTTYCCIHLHPSQFVLLIVKRLIQILLIIGGVVQNPGPGHIVSADRDERRPSGVVANNASRDALSNAE